MKRSYLVALLFAAFTLNSNLQAALITIPMVTVGNPGNANDTGGGLKGAVNYQYQIAKYMVTIGQYTAFLNAADPSGTNPNLIYNNSGMEFDLNIAGISYAGGASAGAKYAVMSNGGNSSNRPITYVSWFSAARFANWMTNGQGAGSTETGAYTLNNATSGIAPAKNPGAAFYIPTADEWYKAAYFSPNYGGDGIAGYYRYATQSDAAPGNTIGSGANQANYKFNGVFSETQSATYDPNLNYLTDVGAFSGSESFYGTFDQSGNMQQWNDGDGGSASSRFVRGGGFYNDVYDLSSSVSGSGLPSDGGYVAFRLASPDAAPIPEPGTWAAMAIFAGGAAYAGWRRRRQDTL